MVFFSLTYVPSMVQIADPFTRTVTLIFWFVPMALFVGFFFLFWWIKRRCNVSFDYTFVQDELRVTKVFNGKTRKFLTTVKAEQILQIGYAESEAYRRVLAGQRGKPVRLTPNKTPAEGKSFIYLYCTSSLAKTLYLLECREELLQFLVMAAGRNKFEGR